MTMLFSDGSIPPREREIILDSFAGGGGASTGIEMALGRSPDVAINHDPEAVAMHIANHPETEHFCQSVWKVDPSDVAARGPIGLAWFSPTANISARRRAASRSKRTSATSPGLWLPTPASPPTSAPASFASKTSRSS